jgi:D-sedoheptulose 7-phosphate isomerase
VKSENKREGQAVKSSLDPKLVFQEAIKEHIEVIRSVSSQQSTLLHIAQEITQAVLNGKKVLWCGNGGSAADSQHLAAELMGRFRRERREIPSIALTTDTSALTAISNDFGFDTLFQRQAEALCVSGDVLVGISTSGNSKNVCAAMETARNIGALTVAFTGEGGGVMARFADLTPSIPSKDTARIQEAHILCGHMLCDWVELAVCESQNDRSEFPIADSPL